MSWARWLKHVFRIDIERCERCGGKVKIIASIEEPAVAARILAHLKLTAALCREFDISRKTGYKIIARYKDCGLE